MTDVREKVARAIYKATDAHDLSLDTCELIADAALEACGWEKMREALEKIVAADELSVGTQKWCDEMNDALESARSALSLSKGGEG